MNDQEMTLDEAKAEIARLRADNAHMTKVAEALALQLAEARESGKAARRLAKAAMRSSGKPGAHVELKATPRGVRLIICAPPAENEEALGAAIAKGFV